MHQTIGVPSVETPASWTVATVVLVILALSFGAPWITIVALKMIAAELGGLRGLAADDALLRFDRGRRGRSAGGDVSAAAPGAAAADRYARRDVGAEHRDGLAAQSRLRGDGGRRHLLLHSHGHAAGASAGVLQRSRHPRFAWRGDAVGAAGHGLRQPP